MLCGSVARCNVYEPSLRVGLRPVFVDKTRRGCISRLIAAPDTTKFATRTSWLKPARIFRYDAGLTNLGRAACGPQQRLEREAPGGVVIIELLDTSSARA